jgi:hypothetical protein
VSEIEFDTDNADDTEEHGGRIFKSTILFRRIGDLAQFRVNIRVIKNRLGDY